MRVYQSRRRLPKPPVGAQLDWSNPLTRGLVAYFPTNEFIWGPKSFSQAGYRRHEISSSGSGSTWTSGRDGSPAWGITSSGAYAWSQSHSDFDLATGAIFFWFRTTQAPNPIFLHGRHDASNSFHGITIYLEGSGSNNVVSAAMKATGSPGGGGTAVGTIVGNDGGWHMAALNFNQANGAINELYVDGRFSASVTNSGSWTFNGQDLRWGKALDTFWTPFVGQMDFGGWFDRNLTAAEWLELFENPYGWFQAPAIRRYNKLWVASIYNNIVTLPTTSSFIVGAGSGYGNSITLAATTGFSGVAGQWFATASFSATTHFNLDSITAYGRSATFTATTGMSMLQGVFNETVSFNSSTGFPISVTQAILKFLDLQSVTLLSMENGSYAQNISLAATTSLNLLPAFSQYPTLTLAAFTSGGWVVNVTHAGTYTANNTIVFTQSDEHGAKVNASSHLTVSQAATYAKNLLRQAHNQLTISQSGGKTNVLLVTSENTLHVVGGDIRDTQVGVYTRAPARALVLPRGQKQYLLMQTPGWNIVLPPPIIGDTQELLDQVSVKRSMNNQVYTYVKTTDLRKLHYSFRLTRNKSLELEAFVAANIATSITLTTWKGEIWIGYLTVNPIDFVPKDRWFPTRERVDVSLDFEGIQIF